MMKTYITIATIQLLVAASALALPAIEDFSEVSNFPQPAAGSFGVVGTATQDGRFVLWDGDNVHLQNAAGSSRLTVIGSGYAGDPGFITLSPDGNTLLLGAGFGDGANANLYKINLNAPGDFVPGSQLSAQSHFSGVYLNASLVAIDRGDFGFPSEIIVIDVSGFRSPRSSVAILRRPSSNPSRIVVLPKPVSSFSAALAIDPSGTFLYVMDAATSELRRFLVSDVVNAFNTATPLDWTADGAAVGTPGTLGVGGVAGITAFNEMVLPGIGGIQYADATTGAVSDFLDPAGTSPFYTTIYNAATEEIIAIPFPAVFGDPFVAYATRGGLPSLPAASWISLATLCFTLAGFSAWFLSRKPGVVSQ